MSKPFLNYTISFALGIGIASLFSFFIFQKKDLSQYITTDTHSKSEYRYINPLLSCETNHLEQSINIQDLNLKLEKLVKSNIEANKITNASIYFRDLNNGPWIFTGDSEKYSPASLFKITVLLTYYRLAGENPELLQQSILNKLGEDSSYSELQNIKPSQIIEPDKNYTVEELIERMIRYSDNLAHESLVNYLDQNYPGELNKTVETFGFVSNDSEEIPYDGDFVTPKEYSSFLRALYNSSYLSQKYSSKALEIMTDSEYKEGLRAKVPDNIEIAHKFGERGYTNTNAKQLHDCGIIYAENKPYILCVMTKGQDFTKQSNFIKSVSQTVYENYILAN